MYPSMDWKIILYRHLFFLDMLILSSRKDNIISMIQTTDHNRIETFLKEYLIQLQTKFDQCTMHLITQSKFCPKGIQLSLIESQLKEFVRLHHLDLTRKNNYEINKFQDDIREKELFQQLSSYSLTNEQVIF